MGLSSPTVKTLIPDLNSIKVENLNVEYLGEDEFLEIKHLFNADELQLINPSEVYEVELDGKLYYHLKDIGDGDFIGIDKEKRIFRITHDPYKVLQLDSDLNNVLKDNVFD